MTGVIPDDWKTANVTALFKRAKKSDPGNYPPISLTSQVSKILEKLITKELVDYLEINNLLYASQHGFRYKRSCLTNLLDFLEHAVSKLDKNGSCRCTLLRFSEGIRQGTSL